MGVVRNINGLDRLDTAPVAVNARQYPIDAAKNSLANNLRDDSPENKEKMTNIDKLQLALDVAWFEPTYGTIADIVNIVISTFRAILTTEKDERKRHIINAGISAISIIPFADVIKVLKLRKSPKVAKAAIKWARAAKSYAKREKIKGDRFRSPEASTKTDTTSPERRAQEDPYAMAA